MSQRAKPPKLVQRGSYWYVQFHDGSRTRRQSLETEDYQEAQQAFGLWLTAGDAPDNSADPNTGNLLDIYYHKHACNCSQTTQLRALRVRDFFGHTCLSDIPTLVEKFVDERTANNIEDVTIRGDLGILIAGLNWHRKRNRLKAEQIPVIIRPPEGKPRDRWLSWDERDKLLAKAVERRMSLKYPHQYKEALKAGPKAVAEMEARTPLSRIEIFCWLGLECGQRKRAIELLEWDRVDMDHGMIDFRIPGTAQNNKKQSVVPISDHLRPVLERAYDERTNNFVTGGTGNIRTSMENLAAAAGMPDVTPHVLRHTAATHMAEAGVDLWLVAGILGNTLAMVEKVYAHHHPEGLRKAVNYERKNTG